MTEFGLQPEALLRSLGITRPEDIDADAIAWYVGAKVKRRVLKNCEAMIIGRGNKAIISVNSLSMPERQRFSIGHELGHWAHHRGHSTACRSSDIGSFSMVNTSERVADQYSADLLLPWYLFRPLLFDIKRVDLASLKQLASTFHCSLTATLIRLVQSDVHPTTMMIYHTKKSRKWFKAAPSIPGYWFPKDELDADSFAFELLHNPQAKPEGFPRKIGADAWFGSASALAYEITEQSFRLPNGDVVTILRLDERML